MKKIFALILGLFTSIYSFAQSQVAIADSLLLNSEYEQTIRLADTYKGNDENVKYLLRNRKAEALTRLGKADESEQILKDLSNQNVTSLFLQGVTQTTYAQLYAYQGRYDLAEETVKNALQNFDKSGKANSLEAAQAITQLGLINKFTGKHALAEEQMRMALAFRENILPEESELIAASYNDLGLVYAQVDNDKALDYYEKALSLYERLHGKEHPKIAIANSNIGMVYRNLELYGDAINNFETALKIWEKVYSQAHQTKAFNLYNLGRTYKSMGDSKAARGYFERTLKMYRDSYGAKHPEIASVLNDLGLLEMSSNNHNIAINYYQQALHANTTGFENLNEISNPGANVGYYNGNVLLNSLLFKAEAFEARYFEKTIKFSELDNALRILQHCDTLIDELRQHSTNEADKISLGVVANDVYADGVRIAHEAAAVALRKKPYRELAFYFAEKSKSAVLLEAISESDAKSFAGIPAPLLEEEKNMKAAIALTSQKLAQKPTPDEEKYLREALFSLNRGYETFVKKLETQFPSYFNLKFNSASPSISQLQQLLDDKTALLSYFLDDKRGRIYIFQLTKSSFDIIDHELPADFDKSITGFRNGLFYNVVGAYQAAGNKLSKILIPKIPGKIKELVILPTGRLGIIPFETLPLKKTDESSFKNIPYLINEFAVRYEFSAGLLLQKSKSTSTKALSIFLCAPVTFPEKDNLNELPGTESEVKSISELFTSKQMKSTLFLGNDANEQHIKTQPLKDYSLIHFATHGVVDENDPELSRIFLQNNSGSEDGNLFAGEIYNLEMDANLVTLSACQTGLGKISKGEGVIGLSRALVYAGAKNIMVSFWSVADESTSELMKDFYKQLLDSPGSEYSENLRQAKLKLMKNDKYAAPYYWGPFILIGF
jgi:CHAT domain-containing protein